MRRIFTAALIAGAFALAMAPAASAQFRSGGTFKETIQIQPIDGAPDDVTPAPAVPEPGAALAFALGLGVLGLATRKRN